MHPQTFVIVSPSKILREGLFVFLRENGYSSFCIHKLSNIEDVNSIQIVANEMILIIDDGKQSPETACSILSQYASPKPTRKVILVSLSLNVNYIEQVVAHPNTGFVFHRDLDQHLLSVVDMLSLGMMSISPTALRLYLEAKKTIELGNLTDIDLQVLDGIVDGHSIEDMVSELNMSKRSLYRVRHKLREVLDAPNPESIVDRARQLGLIS